MTTPDTTEDGLTLDHKEALFEVLTPWVRDQPYPDNAIQELFEDLAEPIAAIRRQAAADALNEQADDLAKTAAFMRDQARAHTIKVRRGDAVVYDSMADAYFGAAKRCRDAAADKLAEGYAYTCPWTAPANRENPSDYCENRVEHEGDHCPQHETEDDDRWAE